MTSWKDEYMAALEARDATEKADLDFYQAYTRMADRNTQLLAASTATTKPPPAAPVPSSFLNRRANSASPAPGEPDAQLRLDLGKAQQQRADLQAKLDRTASELEKLRSRSKVDNRRLTQITAELDRLSVRVRDRDDESKGKAKLMDNMQDEVVTLNLQLNMAEEDVKRLKAENKDLVDRWMKWKGREADQMNEQSKF